jgi:sulfite exporter TauE/SafE
LIYVSDFCDDSVQRRGMDASLSGLWALCMPGVAQGGLLTGLFIAGAAGSAMHCVPMCGGFVLGQAADRMAAVPAAKLCEWRRLRAGLLPPYHLGRLTTYAMLGALAASSASVLGRAAWLSGLSAALLLLAAGLFLTHAAARVFHLGLGVAAPSPAWSRVIGRMTRRLNRTTALGGYLLGVALGLLPCGFLYGALVAAAATGDATMGAAAMLAFGLGTVPSLVMVGVAGQAAGRRWRRLAALAAPPVLALNAVVLIGLAWRQIG